MYAFFIAKLINVWYNISMVITEAKKLIASASASYAIEYGDVQPSVENSAVAYLTGHCQIKALEKVASEKKCPLYANLISAIASTMNTFDSSAMIRLNKKLNCDDVNAGALRKKNIELDGAACCDYTLIKGSLKNVLTRLNKTESSPEISKADFTVILSHYLQELAILSPFETCNGLTRRTFLQKFALSRGFTLDYSQVQKDEYIKAERAAFAYDDPQLLFAVLTKCVSYYTPAPALTTTDKKRKSPKPKSARTTKKRAPARKQDDIKKAERSIEKRIDANKQELYDRAQNLREKMQQMQAELNELLELLK